MAEFANDSIKGVKELRQEIDKLNEELVETAKIALEVSKNIKVDKATAKEIQNLTQAQQILASTQKELTKAQKQEADLIAKINTLRNGEQDEIIALKTQQAELLKQKKLEAKENAGLITQYQKQSKHLRDLKNEFKDATLQGSKTKKELAKMRKEIIKLDKELVDLDDSVNDSFRNIGKYEQAIERLEKDMLKLAAAGAAVGGSIAGIKGSLNASEEGSEDLREATGKLDAALNIAKNTAASATLDLIDFGKALWNGKTISDAAEEGFNRTAKATENFGDKIEKAFKASDDAVNSQITLEKISRKLRKEVEILNGEIDKQNAIAGDTTRGMNSIAEANERALKSERERNTILVALAKSELDIINARIAATAEGANNLDLLNQQAEKEIELIGLRNDLRTSTIELDKEIALNERDQFEKALDFALDLFDTQKTLNERGIADENKTFNERVKLLDRTVELSNKAFQEQIRLAEKQVGERLKLNELIAIDDEKIIFERINALTQDEIVQQRLLDIIRDRKTAILDLADAERELNQAIKERGEEDAAMNAEEAKALEDAANALTQFRLDQKESIDDQIAAERFRADILLNNDELLADERTLIEEQFQAKIKQLREKAAEDESALLKERRDEALKFAQDLTGELGEELSKRSDERIAGIDSEIEDTENALEKQEDLAEQGAENTLAFEKERAAKLTLQREEELKKRQQQEEAIKLAEAFISAFEARVSDDPDTAIQKATQDVVVARGIAKTIAGFAYDGVEDTGESGGLDNKGGKLWMLHPHERVMSKAQNQMVGDISNDELANLAYNYRIGIPTGETREVINSSAMSENVANKIVKAIENQPFQQINVDELGNIIETISDGNIKKVTRLKTRSRL